MIANKSVLAIIPARGGSKGIKNKNLQFIGDKSLLQYTIDAAQQSQFIDRLVLSSDDLSIIALAEKLGCEVPFIRPNSLAEDDTPGVMPILHAMDTLGFYDYVVVLQVTSPLRIAADIDGCIERCVTQHAPCCVTVTEVTENPYWMFTLDNDKMQPLIAEKNITRRQDLPTVYQLNGAVYVAEYNYLQQQQTFLTKNTIAYPMPQARSVDIDTGDDMAEAAHQLGSNLDPSLSVVIHHPF